MTATARWAQGKRTVLMLVGTDLHPFARACAWADQWATTHPEDDVLVQHGYTEAPRVARGVEILPPQHLTELLNGADIVVTHGGPGTISAVRATGRTPIILPRDPQRGEHVDDHQLRFAAWANERGLGVVAYETGDLDKAVEHSGLAPATRGTDPSVDVRATVNRIGAHLHELAHGHRYRRTVPSLRRARRGDGE